MSSTDAEPNDDELRQFYDDRIKPIAEMLRSQRVRLIQLELEDDEDSWYEPYPADAEPLVKFEAAQLEKQLTDLWNCDELRKLHALAGPLAEMARRLSQGADADDPDVSDFIYEMY